MTHKTIVVFESDWEFLSGERKRLTDDNERLRAENEVLKRLVRDLREIGTGAVAHDFDGDCPYEKYSRHWRDSSCPACKVLMAADAALRGEGE